MEGGRPHLPLAPIASHGSAEELSEDQYFMEPDEVMVGGSSVSPIRSSDLDRVSNTSSNSKSRESLASITSRSTMSSVEQQQHQHRPRSATTVSNSSAGSHFLRPKSLAISSGFVKIWKKDRSRLGNTDITGTSCPTVTRTTARRKSDRKSVPLIRYDFVSAPSTPNSETDSLWMESKHSVSTEVIPEIEKRSNNRTGSYLSLNLAPNSDKSRNPSPNSRSPKLISRFLRSSFARLMSFRSSGSNDGEGEFNEDRCHSEGGTTAQEEPYQYQRRGYEEMCSPEYTGHLPCTPSTQAYIEETRLSGLPVIPFAYPTCVLVERMKNRTRDRVRQTSGEYPSAQTPTARAAGATSNYDGDDGYFFDPTAHSPLENLVDIAQQELTEEETLFGLYDDSSHHNNTGDGSVGTAAGSVGSACSAFDFYYNGCEVNNKTPVGKKTSLINNNNIKNNTVNKAIPRGLDSYSFGDFYMEDELNLSDPTKSSWRRDLVPITTPSIPAMVHQSSGPYLDMTYNHGTPIQGRSKAVPIGNHFSVPESPHLSQYSNSAFSKHK